MAKEPYLTCENCGAAMGKLQEAFVWLDKPVCKTCFNKLASTKSLRHRAIWMPIAIITLLSTIVLSVLLVLQNNKQEPNVDSNTIPQTKVVSNQQDVESKSNPVQTPKNQNTPPDKKLDPSPVVPAKAQPVVAGPSREEILDMLKIKRTWFWRWEQLNKDHPFEFIVDATDNIYSSGDTKPEYKLELRWVLSVKDHIFLPVNSQNLYGFFIGTGRQAGAFTDNKIESK